MKGLLIKIYETFDFKIKNIRFFSLLNTHVIVHGYITKSLLKIQTCSDVLINLLTTQAIRVRKSEGSKIQGDAES